jgi:hypothetical protein
MLASDDQGRPLEAPACDECGAVPALLRVDSALGLEVWNFLHPPDQRTALWFCTEPCILAGGQRLGLAMVKMRDA